MKQPIRAASANLRPCVTARECLIVGRLSNFRGNFPAALLRLSSPLSVVDGGAGSFLLCVSGPSATGLAHTPLAGQLRPSCPPLSRSGTLSLSPPGLVDVHFARVKLLVAAFAGRLLRFPLPCHARRYGCAYIAPLAHRQTNPRTPGCASTWPARSFPCRARGGPRCWDQPG